MSYVAAYRQDDRAFILADAAHYDAQTGRVMKIDDKVRALPGMAAAYAVRGPGIAIGAFRRAVQASGAVEFDDLLDDIGDIAADFKARLGSRASDATEVVLAGWSARHDRPLVLFWTNYLQIEEFQPDHIYSVDAFSTLDAAPPIPPTEFTVARGVAQIEAARRAPTCHIDPVTRRHGPVICSVGGHATLAEITRDGVELKVVARWPEDQIGEPMRPAA